MDKTYCIFGDSVTQAAYVNNGWVNLFKTYLENSFPNDFINVFNLGIGGDTTENVLARFDNEARVRFPSTIIFAVGINDTKEDNPDRFRSNIETLLDSASKFTTDITFIGLVLGDWQGDEPYSQDKTVQYNQILQEIAGKHSCRFIPLQNTLKPSDFLDGLHPNELGHQNMFEEIRKYF